MNILEIKSLNKQYGQLKALDNVDLDVARGSVFGLLGPNGAGKTTLLRIINSILVKDSGSVKINGEDVSLATSHYLGYMPEERGLYGKMQVEEQIMYFGLLKGGEKSMLRQNMKEYMELFELSSDGKRKVEELSKGNQQKVQIISTLVHDPELVILDEPFSGFDPINGALLTQLINRLHNRNVTVMLSSHNMPAIEEMCSDIALINRGQMLLSGRIEDIKEANKTGKLELTTRSPLSVGLAMDSEVIESIEQIDSKDWRKGITYSIRRRPNVSNNDILQAISMQAEILHFEEVLPSLNDIFIKYTVGEIPNKNL
ncbi:MAG: ATP-binding cassette domain-containing protein [Muribaculaceae bacterium]|nr:ATP-binding cassette domain-containing protein [Muribaculaceae bacterium]